MPAEAHRGVALRPYQQQGAAFLSSRGAALLADEMGLGKTAQAITALQAVLPETASRRALVVAPATLRLNWLNELRTWAPHLGARVVQGSAADRRAHYQLPVPVLVTSYDHLRADIHSLPAELKFGAVLLDEAQRIKNPDSATALAARLVPRERSWAMTGTPLENRAEDLAAIFQFVKPRTIAAGMSRSEMVDAIKGMVLRRTKSEVLPELPPIISQDMPLAMTGAQRDAYDEAWSARHAGDEDRGDSTASALALITQLKQLCNADPETGQSTKLDALQLICENLSGADDKLLVFSQYVASLELLRERLEIPTLLYHGGLSDDERERVLDEFRDRPGPVVLLMSLRAGAVGLNLQEASTVVLFDRWWNPAIEDQAIQRAHRFGRQRPLHVFKFLVTESIEERIDSLLREKRELFESYVNRPDWESYVAPKRDDLRRILR